MIHQNVKYMDGNFQERVFSKEEARKLIDEIVSHAHPNGDLCVQVSAWWSSGQKWARNRLAMGADRRDIDVFVGRSRLLSMHEETGRWTQQGRTNQIDPVSLSGITNFVDFHADKWKDRKPLDRIIDVPSYKAEGSNVWSDLTYNINVESSSRALNEVIHQSEQSNMVTAGYLEMVGATSLRYVRDRWGRERYEWGNVTQAQFSITARDPKGNGSSSAGKSSFNWGLIDYSDLAKTAFEKCKKSLNPVRIEPGRYQTILEPAATATIVRGLISTLHRSVPEDGRGAFYLGANTSMRRHISKLGLKIIDERLNIYHDPLDPLGGTHPAPMHNRIDFVRSGVLTAMTELYEYSLNERSASEPAFATGSFRVTGGDTSIEEMIASTRRGLIASRLVQSELLDRNSVLFSGLTRDGLWLVENGVVTKPVRNFKWTESPLFVLNNVEQIGIEEQVFDPVEGRYPLEKSFARSLNNVIVPAMKVNDFSFVATVDAI